MFGDNIKVHFAGSDGEEIFYASLKAARIVYRLYSCYKYIVNKPVDSDFTLPDNHVIKVQQRENRHVIQDSGLFTLMFGAGKGQKQTKESLIAWQDKLIAFVLQNKLQATCVEIDCQKVLNPEAAWFFRERMRKLLPNRQINVFHFEDGKDGLDRLIEFADYIAISVPELRIIKPKTFQEDTKRLSHYIKNKKPEIDIHLLGCTDIKLLKDCSYCTSADSTSWLQGVKYGFFRDVHSSDRMHIRHFRRDIFEKRKSACFSVIQKRNVTFSEKTLDYCTNASLCATICKSRYTHAAGSQE